MVLLRKYDVFNTLEINVRPFLVPLEAQQLNLAYIELQPELNILCWSLVSSVNQIVGKIQPVIGPWYLRFRLPKNGQCTILRFHNYRAIFSFLSDFCQIDQDKKYCGKIKFINNILFWSGLFIRRLNIILTISPFSPIQI